MSVNGQWFRAVLGHVPTAVVVVTGLDSSGDPVGFSCGSFFSVSLDPPLVGFCVAITSTSWPRFTRDGFCVNVLTEDQHLHSRRFAASGGEKFDGVAWQPGMSGRPQLARALAWIDCTTTNIHRAGDHMVVIGSVAGLSLNPSLPKPLVFHCGGYGTVGHPEPANRRAS
jgi:3-hydroxy-9,10-secoandrosta-1,3,5(10)-triene-9,17-dione monooxygenase reductase component